MARSFEQCLKRFPITMGFIALLSVFLLVLCWGKDEWFTERQTFTVNYYLTVGSLLSLTLQLWGEEVKRKRILYIVHTLCHALLLIDTIYLYRLPEGISLEIALAHAAALTALGLSVLTLPFFREKNDVASWYFTLQLATHAATSWAIGGIMCGGIALLTASFSSLFGMEIKGNYYSTWLIVFCLTLPSYLFLGQIPSGEAKHDPNGYTSAFLRKVIRYLFLPLLGCYLLVLYIYTVKILIQGQLPNGWVSWLVTALTAGCIGVEFSLYPSLQRQDCPTFERRVARWLPVTILPLLMLMTFGIARRFNDYGLTLNRLYLLTLNIWFYIVCIGLFALRARRIQWIAVSFAVIFLLTSVFPVNYTDITRRYLLRSMSAQIQTSYQGRLPMRKDVYLDWLSSLPQDEALLANSRLKMLSNTFDAHETNRWVNPSVNFREAENYIEGHTKVPSARNRNSTENNSARDTYVYFHSTARPAIKMDLKNGYASLIAYDKQNVSVSCKKWKEDILPLELTSNERTTDTIFLKPSDLLKWSTLESLPPQKIINRRNGNLFILTEFFLSGNINDPKLSLTYSGYYFIKKETD
ncbi:MAG: DUF4153 domain-containing protein [Paraprevotella sp.]|nr:DUF4153 domain-containing protein [Paraprevotella sp.]